MQPGTGFSILVLLATGFEQGEFTDLQRALLKAGHRLKIASVDSGVVNGWDKTNWGHYFPVDASLSEVLASDYDALFLPGGERSISKLKQNLHTRRLINNFLDRHKPIAAIGQGLDLFTISDLRFQSSRTLSAPASLQKSLETCGLKYSSEPFTVDHNLITAAGPEALPQFVTEVLRTLSPAQESQAA